jgi:hypothetical protein
MLRIAPARKQEMNQTLEKPWPSTASSKLAARLRIAPPKLKQRKENTATLFS